MGGDEANLHKHDVFDGNSRGTEVRTRPGQFRGEVGDAPPPLHPSLSPFRTVLSGTFSTALFKTSASFVCLFVFASV